MAKDFLTTTEAAKILSVAPDTVLRWVKAGKIKSYRTPGGHARIPRTSIDELLMEPAFSLNSSSRKSRDRQYCWEFLAAGGEMKEGCKDCLTYKSRASRCYELRTLSDGLGCLRIGCELSCEECEYYQLMHGQVWSVLILSESRRILSDRTRLDFVNDLRVKFVEDEYEGSYVIEKFRPDFIVIDVAIGRKRTGTFCNHLFNDPRIPVPRIILASPEVEKDEYCHKEIFGWIRKPFTISQLKEYIQGVSLSESRKNVS